MITRMRGAPSRVSARLHQRWQIIKMASDGKLNGEIAREPNVDPQRVRRWRKRWARRSVQLEAAERRMPAGQEMESIVAEILADKLRSGAPSKSAAEQLTKLGRCGVRKTTGLRDPNEPLDGPGSRQGNISARHL